MAQVNVDNDLEWREWNVRIQKALQEYFLERYNYYFNNKYRWLPDAERRQRAQRESEADALERFYWWEEFLKAQARQRAAKRNGELTPKSNRSSSAGSGLPGNSSVG